MKLIVLDVCAGTGSATRAFKDRGHEVETLDIVGEHTYVCDVLEWQAEKKYDFIWCSPPCTCFSPSGLWAHWKEGIPDDQTLKSIEIVKACINICSKANNWAIENPLGMLQTLDFMKDLERRFFRSVVTYCRYGIDRRKPTNIWHNLECFRGKKCKNGDSCHMRSPHGAHLGNNTQDLPPEESGKIPYGLSLEICKAVEAEHGAHG